MPSLREETRVGRDALEAVTTLLQRARAVHPTAGLYEAADLQWWWAQEPGLIETFPQLFWFDDAGRPAAAVITTEWSYGVQMDPIVLPAAAPEIVADVVDRGLDHADAAGYDSVQLEVDRADHVLRGSMSERGFAARRVRVGGILDVYRCSARGQRAAGGLPPTRVALTRKR